MAPFILRGAAFLASISLFMPVASAMGFSVNCFSDEASGEGGFLLFIMLVTIAASILTILLKVKRSRITAGLVGIVAGLVSMIDGFGNVISVSNSSYVSVGAGAVLLALLATRQTPAIPPMPPARPPQSWPKPNFHEGRTP
ncbi:hypothetical protein ACF082_34095 [Streptomyces lydicus]|uniref:hypothetical protein n=1 Tax=Streptomyces lydicus TaxID=47763 RepID=UPI0036F91342